MLFLISHIKKKTKKKTSFLTTRTPIYAHPIGEYCGEENEADCDPLSANAMRPSNITISTVSCTP